VRHTPTSAAFDMSAPLAAAFLGLCPGSGTTPDWHPSVPMMKTSNANRDSAYVTALKALDLSAVQEDLKVLFKTSQLHWPADYGNYGPFFVRLAWHCSGSYRTSDGRGGCDGGRQRFEPERSWDDNTNLDKARGLLWPIKRKYGKGLSWGDLFILAGTTAVQSMGGPILGFCAGRIDDEDGSSSVPLGPSVEQEEHWPCKVNGTCTSPLGSTTVGLIYLNPEGPMGQPHPAGSAPQIRDTFARMAMNDTETVALIGGGHAFGKTHGACPSGPGPSPKEDPLHPWPGTCGSGKGADAFTSGFEGPWTTTPTWWDNSYFVNLLSHQWIKHTGPGGHWQWRVNGTSPTAPGPAGGRQDIMMMTSDVSLLTDPAYKAIVTKYAESPETFDNAWKHAWYKLTTRDMGPYARCLGDQLPPPQPWQHPLPSPPTMLPDFTLVASSLREVLAPPPKAQLLGEFVRLAWQCASTWRGTDYQGGCNGARLRFSPERDWPANAGLDAALAELSPVKKAFGDGLSWSDLIVLAGNTAIEAAGGPAVPFCDSGRTDAVDGSGSEHLDQGVAGDVERTTLFSMHERAALLELAPREYVALSGRHTLGSLCCGFQGASTSNATSFSNAYFLNLADETWEAYKAAGSGQLQYKARGKELHMRPSDLLLTEDPVYLAVVHEYAADEQLWRDDFARAWSKLMAADMYDGPAGRTC